MGFYDDFISGLQSLIGKERPYRSAKQLADTLEIPAMTLHRYLKGERQDYIRSLARLIDGTGGKLTWPGGSQAAEFADDFHPVPKVIARPSGGGGSLETDDTVDNHYAFRYEWLRRKGNPESMRLMAVTGDSMAPLIEDGDSILVDTSQTTLYEGKIYVVRIDDDIVVKRLAKSPGKIILASDNPEAYPRHIDIDLHDESVSWEPVGRVLYVAKDLN